MKSVKNQLFTYSKLYSKILIYRLHVDDRDKISHDLFRTTYDKVLSLFLETVYSKLDD